MATASIEVLDAGECRRLLSEKKLGRLAVVVGGQPLVFPVNYRFAEGAIVFRTGEGVKLSAADFSRVAFEVDDLSDDGMHGWSVVVQGMAYDITDSPDEKAVELRLLDVGSALEGDRWVEIVPVAITGRSVGA